jgi:hypothetical protein
MEAHPGIVQVYYGAAVEVCLGAVEAHPGALETHPGALESHSGAMEAHLGAIETHHGALHSHPKAHSCLTWVHGDDRGSTWTCGVYLAFVEPHPGDLEAHPIGPWMLILGLWRSSWGHVTYPGAEQTHSEVLLAHLKP